MNELTSPHNTSIVEEDPSRNSHSHSSKVVTLNLTIQREQDLQ